MAMCKLLVISKDFMGFLILIFSVAIVLVMAQNEATTEELSVSAATNGPVLFDLLCQSICLYSTYYIAVKGHNYHTQTKHFKV